MSSGSFKIVINKIKKNDIFLILMYKQDLALNNHQGLICHKSKPHQTSKKVYQVS